MNQQEVTINGQTYIVNIVDGKPVMDPLPLWNVGNKCNNIVYDLHVEVVNNKVYFKSVKYFESYSVSIFISNPTGYSFIYNENNRVIGEFYIQELENNSSYCITVTQGFMTKNYLVIVRNFRIHLKEVYHNGELVASYI